MTAQEREATVRVLVDLIKADKVIDSREIDFFNKVKFKFRIDANDEKRASEITLSRALGTLAGANENERKELWEIIRHISISDDFCSREEARLLLAIQLCLDPDQNFIVDCDIISTNVDSVWFDDNQVLFIESFFHNDINKEIEENLRIINKEFNLCGLEFVYIPAVADHYKQSDHKLMQDVLKMLSPKTSANANELLIDKINNLSTAIFCKEQLYYKLNFSNISDTDPALLIKIGQSRIDDKIFTNYLRIYLDKNILDTVRMFCDNFLSLHSVDNINISLKRDEQGKFLYMGFYRQLFDLLSLQKSLVCSIELDFSRHKIVIPEIEETLKRPKEMALYILLLIEKENGINFNKLENGRDEKTKKKVQYLRKLYKKIYDKMNGNPNNDPDIFNPGNRNPMLNYIKKFFLRHSNRIHDAKSFIPVNQNGYYRINAPITQFYSKHFNEEAGRRVPFEQSLIIKNLLSLNS